MNSEFDIMKFLPLNQIADQFRCVHTHATNIIKLNNAFQEKLCVPHQAIRTHDCG